MVAPLQPGGAGQYEIGGKQYDIDSRVLSSDAPKGRVEQLLDSVRVMAGGIVSSLPGRSVSVNSQAAAGAEAGSVGAGEEASGSAGKPGWLGGGQVVGDVLRKFFSDGASSWQAKVANHLSDSGSATSSPFANSQLNSQLNYDGGLSASTVQRTDTVLTGAVRQLQSTHTPPTEQMLDQHGEVRNLILERRSQLNSEAKNVDEQMTIDIVAMLFEFILRDTQVPAEVRAQLGRLQFLVLKMALRDSTLLTQKGHPVRLLVNRIGSISLGLKQLDPSGTQLTKEIVRIVATLLDDETEDSAMFAKALDELDAFIAHELRARDNVESTVQAVEQAQNRTLRFAHTTAQMAQALADLTIDPYLQGFLRNDWVHAIEHADRTDAKRARRFRLLVPDLLWSIVPKLTPDDRSQLFALLPIILNTLREGLGLMGWDTARQQGLLNWLVDAHTSALKAAPHAPASPHLPVIHAHFSKFIDNPEADTPPVLAPDSAENRQFLDDAIKEMNIEVQWIDRILEDDQELAADVHGNDDAASQEANEALVMQKLQNGVALEINLGGKPGLGRLSWVDPQLSSLVLTLEGQTAPSMVSVQMFRRLIDHGRVRFLETEPLFERAVQSLLQSADSMSSAAH